MLQTKSELTKFTRETIFLTRRCCSKRNSYEIQQNLEFGGGPQTNKGMSVELDSAGL